MNCADVRTSTGEEFISGATSHIDSSDSDQNIEGTIQKERIIVGEYVVDILLNNNGQFLGIESIRREDKTGLSSQKHLSSFGYVEDYPNED